MRIRISYKTWCVCNYLLTIAIKAAEFFQIKFINGFIIGNDLRKGSGNALATYFTC